MTEGGKTDSLLRATETVDELAPPAQPMVEVWAHDVAGESPAAKLCSATVSPGGVVAIGTSNGLIMVFNIWEHFQLSTTVDSRSSNSDRPAPITALAFSQRADDSLLVSGHADGRVILWDTANVNQVAKFAELSTVHNPPPGVKNPDQAIRHLESSPDGLNFVALKGRWVNIINHHGSIVKRIVLGVQGQHPRWLSGDTLTVAEGCNIRVLYGLGSSTCTMHYDKIMKSCCHSEVTATVKCGSSKLAVAHSDGTIVLFVKNDETNSNKEAFHLEHVQTKSACKVNTLLSSNNGSFLAALADGKLTTWNLVSADTPIVCEIPSYVSKIAMHKRLPLVAAATNDNNFWFCEASSRPLMGPCHAASSNLSEAFRGVSFFEWHENGLLLSVSKLGSVVLWRADGKPVAERLGDVQAQARHMHQRLMPNGCNEPQKGAASADIIASTSNGRPDENHPESSSSSSERIQEDRRDIQDVSSPSASHGKNPAIEVGPDKGSVMMGHSPMTPESAKPAAVTNTSPEIEDVNAEDDDQPHGNDGVPENGHIVVAAALNFNSEQCKRAPPSSTEEGLSFNNEESKLPSPPSPSEGPSAIRSSPSNVVRELHQATTPPANRHVSNNHRFSGPPPTNNNQQHWPGNHTPAPSRHPQSMSMVMPAPGAYYMPWYPHQGTVPAQVSSMHGTFQGAGTGRGSALPGSAPPQHMMGGGGMAGINMPAQQWQAYQQQCYYQQQWAAQQAAAQQAAAVWNNYYYFCGAGTSTGAANNNGPPVSAMYPSVQLAPPSLIPMQQQQLLTGVSTRETAMDPYYYGMGQTCDDRRDHRDNKFADPNIHVDTVYVGNLSPKVTEKDLSHHFGQYGRIVNIHILKDKTSQGSRGFAFIHYEDVREAMNAVSDMCEGKQLPGNFDGRTVKCSYSRRVQGNLLMGRYQAHLQPWTWQ